MKPLQDILREAINVTDNSNFWKWFGNSKVVDKHGNPLIVYHGTHSLIKSFRATRGSHLGFHFGDIEAANMRLQDTSDGRVDKKDLERQNQIADEKFKEWKKFQQELDSRDMDIPDDELLAALDRDETDKVFAKYAYKPTEEEARTLAQLKQAWEDNTPPIFPIGTGGNVGQYYLSAQKLLRMYDVGNWGSPKCIKEHLPFDSDARTVGEIRDDIRARGYDGIIYKNRVEGYGEDSFIVFEPTQIKSAIGNNGNFDPNNPDITK